MHELGITRNIVAICSERARGRKVVSVTLEIGQLSTIVPDAIRFCFDLVAEGTPVERAALKIEDIAGRGECRECGRTFPMDLPYGRCECGSSRVALVAGEELKIREMEVE